MKGLLVINEYYKTSKFEDLYRMILDAFGRRNEAIEIKTNADLLTVLGGKEALPYDYVLFYDKDTALAKHLENKGMLVMNSADTITVCDDKRLTALALETTSIKTPKTIMAPFTYCNVGYTNYLFLESVIEELNFPIIMKEALGSFGQQVYLIEDKETLKKKFTEVAFKSVLFQEFIASSFGRDVRVQVVGNRAVASVLRTGREGDFRSNVTNGGKMERFTPSKEFIDMAIQAAEAVKADFAGVDILFGNDGEPVLCEINSNAHFRNLYDATGINVADNLADYVLRKARG